LEHSKETRWVGPMSALLKADLTLVMSTVNDLVDLLTEQD